MTPQVARHRGVFLDSTGLVFVRLASFGITIVDVNTGMASDNVAARTTFAALGIANDALASSTILGPAG